MERIHELVEEWQRARSAAVRNRIAEHYWPLLRRLAAKQAARLPAGCEWNADALASEGFFGLIQALDGFDAGRGIQFITYASQRIRGAMLDAIRNADFVPRSERARQKNGAAIRELRQFPLTWGTESRSPAEREPVAEARAPDARERTEGFWRRWLRGLSQRERLVLLLYYREDRPMREIGEHIGLSESRVSQMHSELMRRLAASELEERSPMHPMPDPEPMTSADRHPTTPVRAAAPPMSCAAFLNRLSLEECDDQISYHRSELVLWQELRQVLVKRDAARAGEIIPDYPNDVAGKAREFILRNGPSTSNKIAAGLGISSQAVGATLGRSREFELGAYRRWQIVRPNDAAGS